MESEYKTLRVDGKGSGTLGLTRSLNVLRSAFKSPGDDVCHTRLPEGFSQTPRRKFGKEPHEQCPATPPAFQSGLFAGQFQSSL